MEEKCPVCGLSLSQKANKKTGKGVKGRGQTEKKCPVYQECGTDSGSV